ncbi:snRNA-activating protein complex subunit 4 [Scaptodrosophila lebanonensis]|uniref:snRNA-activating protein complex subunit 4 n=1 Tax=Drosophila lebanonensis TaxID=7225 RepID=A0A6J2TFX4_DROLE|nr:snRNA-activating protein complex subunit 4 [Scaptodrosophila lebanonensis]
MCDLELDPDKIQQEIIELLLSVGSEVSDGNALLLNQEMQRMLEQIQMQIMNTLSTVRARYERNEQILMRRLQPRKRRACNDNQNIGISGAVLRGGSFRFKGNLYFRDMDGRSCPNNSDYEKRCCSEMFPTDFDMRSKHVWTVLDKKNIVMGIKSQLMEHKRFNANGLKDNKVKKNINLHSKTLLTMLSEVKYDNSFKIDWLEISSLNVDYRHSAYSCEAMWNVYLSPEIRRTKWSQEEDECLLKLVKEHNGSNWPAIAEKMNNRSDYLCYLRYQEKLRFYDDANRAHKWNHKDDERLRAIVAKYTTNGFTEWASVLAHFPGKAKSTLIGRYTYVLHPNISHEPFTVDEDIMLYAAVEEYNGRFYSIPRSMFPKRSLTQLRTRYFNVLAQRHKTDSWSIEDDKKLIDFVAKNGQSAWLDCAEHLGNHTRTSCRTRFLVIKRYLERCPNAKVEDIPRRRPHKNTIVTQENWAQRLEEWRQDPKSLEPQKKRMKVENIWEKQMPKGIDLQVYDYFKYGYNLQLDYHPKVTLPKDNVNLCQVISTLFFNPPDPGAFKKIRSTGVPAPLCRCYTQMVRELQLPLLEPKTQVLPPNWSTLMGFRTLCIVSSFFGLEEEPQVDLVYDECTPAVQLFRQRLRALFFRVALLTRLSPNHIEGMSTYLEALPKPVNELKNVRTTIEERNNNREISKRRRVTEVKAEVQSDEENESHTVTFEIVNGNESDESSQILGY